jgi:gentisate 1,2-dioxygenase
MPSSTETQSQIEALSGLHALSTDTETESMLRTAESNHTKPLWLQMSRLNPPEPNPKCIPYVWEYANIRPSLLKAGELITEKQAERRVLMLVNPSRGQMLPQ